LSHGVPFCRFCKTPVSSPPAQKLCTPPPFHTTCPVYASWFFLFFLKCNNLPFFLLWVSFLSGLFPRDPFPFQRFSLPLRFFSIPVFFKRSLFRVLSPVNFLCLPLHSNSGKPPPPVVTCFRSLGSDGWPCVRESVLGGVAGTHPCRV